MSRSGPPRDDRAEVKAATRGGKGGGGGGGGAEVRAGDDVEAFAGGCFGFGFVTNKTFVPSSSDSASSLDWFPSSSESLPSASFPLIKPENASSSG
jgi:hypothetical protein